MNDDNNVHHIERPEDYLSADEMALLAQEAAAEFTVTKAAWDYQYERAERAERDCDAWREIAQDAVRGIDATQAALADLRARVGALCDPKDGRVWATGLDEAGFVLVRDLRALLGETGEA